MGWTPGSSPFRTSAIGNLKEANLQLKGLDNSVRSAIQQCEDDIASTDCMVQFWREPLLLEEPVEEGPIDRDEAGKATPPKRRSRGYQLGWAKVGKDWRLAYREATRNSFTTKDGQRQIITVPADKARPLVDAPRLLKATSVEGLNDFVNELAHFVIETAARIQNGLTSLKFWDGGES